MMKGMNGRDDLRDFLMSRRAKLTPEDVNVLSYGQRARRVPGLRRDEVARLAGVSVDYYARFERGQVPGVSDSILDAVARALRLTDVEREHLGDLVRALGPARSRSRRPKAAAIRPSIQRLLDAMDGTVAAFVCNASMDVVAYNTLGAALFSNWRTAPGQVPNQARFLFLEPAARELFTEWDTSAEGIVAILRAHAGRDPHDVTLAALIGELSMRSDAFGVLWARHDVGNRYSGVKHFHHSQVGDLTLDSEVIPLPADPGLTLITHSAPAGSPSDDGLRLLASTIGLHAAPAK
ncbi:helix-turn-helix transcriptional regulator [Nonomuraea sp. NPDC004186]